MDGEQILLSIINVNHSIAERAVHDGITVLLQFDRYWLQVHTYALTLTTNESSDPVRNAGALAVFRRPGCGIADRNESSGEIAKRATQKNARL